MCDDCDVWALTGVCGKDDVGLMWLHRDVCVCVVCCEVGSVCVGCVAIMIYVVFFAPWRLGTSLHIPYANVYRII